MAEIEKEPKKLIEWSIETYYPKLAIASSFSLEDTILIALASEIRDDVRVVFLDTNFHFRETYEFIEHIRDRYDFILDIVKARMPLEQQIIEHGVRLHDHDIDLCCHINKVEPIMEVLKGVDAWVTGLRRVQSSSRQDLKQVEYQDDLVKISPLAAWTSQDVREFAEKEDVPVHPLYDLGYKSIGCMPCTRPVRQGEHERSGRWSGANKLECGIHTFNR